MLLARRWTTRKRTTARVTRPWNEQVDFRVGKPILQWYRHWKKPTEFAIGLQFSHGTADMEWKKTHTHTIWGKYLNEHFSTIGIVYNFHLSKFMSQVIRCEKLLPFSQLVLLLSSARMTIALHSISFLFFFCCCYCWLWTQASYHTAIVRMNSILFFFNFESWSVHLMGLIHDVRSLQKWNSALHTSFHAMVLLTGMRATNPSSWS